MVAREQTQKCLLRFHRLGWEHDFDWEIGTWKLHASRPRHPLSGANNALGKRLALDRNPADPAASHTRLGIRIEQGNFLFGVVVLAFSFHTFSPLS
jgi:hypothetical protein